MESPGISDEAVKRNIMILMGAIGMAALVMAVTLTAMF